MIMKNWINNKSYRRYFLLIGIFGLGLFLSCDGLLKENPKNQVFKDNFFENENDAIGAVNAIYAQLNSTSFGPTFGGVYHSTYWVIQGLASDEMNNRAAGSPQDDQLATFSYNASNPTIFDMWVQIYRAIFNANFALDGITDSAIDESLKARLIGEASFLRALMYFELVRMYGEVPLIIEDDAELRPEKATIDAIYTQIINDLGVAISNLPDQYPQGDGRGRATWGAAKTLLAKVYLKTGDNLSAAEMAQDVIDSNIYDLWPDFKDAFNISNENGMESVFNIGFGDANGSISFWEVGQFNVRLLPGELAVDVPGINAQGWQVATQELYDNFDPLDRRRAITFITSTSSGALDDPHIRKYWDEVNEPNGGNTESDFPYIRYSEVYLILAEALNEQNRGPTAEAYEAINTVRRRARFDGTTEQSVLPDLAGLSYDEFRDAVLLERRKEFVAEGKRWFDLVRMDKLSELVPIAKPGVIPQAYHVLFPIPLEEIDLNQNLLPQNTGY